MCCKYRHLGITNQSDSEQIDVANEDEQESKLTCLAAVEMIPLLTNYGSC